VDIESILRKIIQEELQPLQDEVAEIRQVLENQKANKVESVQQKVEELSLLENVKTSQKTPTDVVLTITGKNRGERIKDTIDKLHDRYPHKSKKEIEDIVITKKTPFIEIHEKLNK